MAPALTARAAKLTRVNDQAIRHTLEAAGVEARLAYMP
jgi:hypothetical protein